MAEHLMGVETEYGFAATGRDGDLRAVMQAPRRLLELAGRQLPSLPRFNPNGHFFGSGSLYIDSGGHPEFCTPECVNPWDLVRYVLAGESILNQLAQDLETNGALAEVRFFKNNVDYRSGHTWGCHESYLTRTEPEEMSRHLIPFLSSRLIYTGAGGFNALSAGLEFMISPRVAHLVHVVSDGSTSDRGIFHTKDETLGAQGYHRLHIICGESLCSHVAMWLKGAVTMLVVSMIDAGVNPGEDVQPRFSALDAMRAFAVDTECKAEVESSRDEAMTALSIQRHYLEAAEAHLHDAFMPGWSQETCRHWRAILDRLENAAETTAGMLDWAIKLALYKNYVKSESTIPWESFPHFNYVLEQMISALDDVNLRNKPLKIEFVIGPNSPIKKELRRLAPYLHDHGLRWEDLRSFYNLRSELFEIDTRFAQLGQKGIFATLDAAGVLEHRFDGVDDIEHAVHNPPSTGRANLRGNMIKDLSGKNGRYLCDWTVIWDREQDQVFDLSDPFGTTQSWRKADAGGPEISEELSYTRLRRILEARRADRRTAGRA